MNTSATHRPHNPFAPGIHIVYFIMIISIFGIGLQGCSRKGNDSETTTTQKMDSLTQQIQTTHFGKMEDGRDVNMYTLANSGGMELDIINYGGIITSIRVPDREGTRKNVVLGFDNLKQYLDPHPFFGALIGRYANRIAAGTFTLDRKTYQLPLNDGPNHLHGGGSGYYTKFWDAEIINGTTLQLSYLSIDGEEGYPGNLEVDVTISISESNELIIDYHATTDQPTPVNLTNHSYFNLTGDYAEDILGHLLTIHGASYTPIDRTLIPTGEIVDVQGTPFDFTSPRSIGERIGQVPGGYDHNYILNPSQDDLPLVAELYDPESGRKMQIYTSKPGLQFYSGNFLDGSLKGFNGAAYRQYAGLCLETQFFPDSPNQPHFPSTILSPGDVYRSTTIYKFLTDDE